MKQTIKQLFQAEELVDNYINKKMKSPRLAPLKEKSAKALTFVAIEAIDRMILQGADLTKDWIQFPVAPICCEIGKNIFMDQIEDFPNEKEREFTFFKAGWAILSAIGTHDDLTFKTIDEEGVATIESTNKLGKKKFVEINVMNKNTYLVIRNVELFVRLALFIPINSKEIPVSTRPSLTPPKDWKGFYHPVVGPLANKCSRRVKRLLNRNSNSRLFKMINKQQGTGYRVNRELHNALDELEEQKHTMFTLDHLTLDEDQKKAAAGELTTSLNESAKLLHVERFYEYRKLCFRYRTYSRLNGFKTDGNSLGRALYQFEYGKKVGTKGIRWMKIHASNSFGEDKETLDNREKFADDNLDQWIRWGENPVETADEWFHACRKNGGKPFEFIGAIIDIKNMMLCDDPTEYVSHNPVFLDATCSGIMILAMLTRDAAAGRETNLIKSIIRGDAYAYIAEGVRKDFKATKVGEANFNRLATQMELLDFNIKIAKKDDRPKKLHEAKSAKRIFIEAHQDDIKSAARYFWSRFNSKQLRSLCKRPVMCIPYSAGWQTNSDSLLSDFKPEPEYEGINSFYCDYLSKEISKSFKIRFPRVSALMEKFVDRCKEMSETDTNYGFNVPFTNAEFEQNYRDHKTQQVGVWHKGLKFQPRIIVSKHRCYNPVNASNGASPNSVHALDAALLCYIVITCKFDVIAIHDSIGCLAADTDLLYTRTRVCLNQMFKDETILEKKLNIKDFKLGELVPDPINNQFVFS